MDETRARFLAAIAKQLPAERIAETHLFAAIRQGGVESGVAVIALEQEHVTEATPGESSAQAFSTDAPAADDVPGTVEGGLAGTSGAESDEPTDADSPYANEADSEPAAIAAPAAPRRYVVCTARYRHPLKGPDRGKGEVTVTEEADAPLLTVDAVVRGVQRRSGDADEVVRLSGDEFRAALPTA